MNNIETKKKIIIFFLSFSTLLFSQHDSLILKNTELKLMPLLSSLSQMKKDQAQNSLNDSIISIFQEILHLSISFSYSFDSLKNIGKVTSPDHQIKLYTWNIPYEDGSHRIAGIIQYRIQKDSVNYILLQDHSNELENVENIPLTPNNWYGALYYEIIEKKINKQKNYFLMGYHPWNLFSNKKVLDVMYFDESGHIQFGKPLFVINYKTQYRLIFEYNEKAAMALHYNERNKMIVFSHLVPIDQKIKNNPIFYVPDFSFDGLVFKNDVWNFVEDVDVRNE